jgi:hypothetical protein
MTFEKWELDASGLGQETVTGPRQYYNEPSGSVTDQLTDYQFLFQTAK